MNDVHALMQTIGRDAVVAAARLRLADAATKNHALRTAAGALRAGRAQILAANKADMLGARSAALSDSSPRRRRIPFSCEASSSTSCRPCSISAWDSWHGAH